MKQQENDKTTEVAAYEAPLEIPEAAPADNLDTEKNQNEKTTAGRRNKTRLLLAAVILSLVVLLGTFMGLYFAKDKEKAVDCDEESESPDELPDENTAPPNENPFQDDPKIARLYSILEPIAPSGFYMTDPAEEALPEYRAWKWLSERDMSIDTNRAFTPDWKIVERYVLAIFFYATNGGDWDNAYDFLSNSPVCDWKGQDDFQNGVRFCSEEGSVTMLHIEENGIEGSIPTYLGLLSNLSSLDLPGNLISGTIPKELSKLTKLTARLDLSGNQLTGTLSPSLGNLTDLTELRLNENRLVGAIPTEIALMTSLTALNLGTNQLVDGIPMEIDNLVDLEDLRLDSNLLSGRLPSSIGNLSNIRKLHLHQNELSGPIPSSLSQLQNRGTSYR